MSKYSVSDLVEFKNSIPRWVVQQYDNHDRLISWEVYNRHNKPVIDNQYALICQVQVNGKESTNRYYEFWGESKYDESQSSDSRDKIFYYVMWNNLYCMVKESDIKCRLI